MADGNGFTNKEMLLRIEEKLDKALENHDTRISALETFVLRIKGGSRAVGAILATAIPIAAIILKF